MAKKTKRKYDTGAGRKVLIELREAYYPETLAQLAAVAGVRVTTARAVIKRMGRKVKVNRKVYPATYELR